MANATRSNAVRKPPTYEDNDWISVPEAARQLDCAVQTVYNRALKGELETLKFANRLYVSRASVEAAVAAARVA